MKKFIIQFVSLFLFCFGIVSAGSAQGNDTLVPPENFTVAQIEVRNQEVTYWVQDGLLTARSYQFTADRDGKLIDLNVWGQHREKQLFSGGHLLIDGSNVTSLSATGTVNINIDQFKRFFHEKVAPIPTLIADSTEKDIKVDPNEWEMMGTSYVAGGENQVVLRNKAGSIELKAMRLFTIIPEAGQKFRLGTVDGKLFPVIVVTMDSAGKSKPRDVIALPNKDS